jgi:hypothetical protein
MATTAKLSADATALYVTSAGVDDPLGPTLDPGSITRFSRDPSTGLLQPPTSPSGCLSGAVTDGIAGCTRADVLGNKIVWIGVIGHDLYALSTDAEHLTSIIEHVRDAGADAGLTFVPAPGGCLGTPASQGTWDFPLAPTISQPCELVRGFHQSYGGIAVSPVGRDFVFGTARYLIDLDPLYSKTGILHLVRDPRTGALTQPPAADGCLQTRPRSGCASIPNLQDPGEPAFDHTGRRILIPSFQYDSELRRETILMLARTRSGYLHSVSGAAGCATTRRLPHCQRVRGLLSPGRDAEHVSLGRRAPVFAPDDRFAYVLEEGVTVFSIDG